MSTNVYRLDAKWFELSEEEALAQFAKLKAAHLEQKCAEQHAEQRALVEQIEGAAASFLACVQQARACDVRTRAGMLSTVVLPLRHRYGMHPFFPCLYMKIPESYPSNCVAFDSERHLDELEAAIKAELAVALARLCRCS